MALSEIDADALRPKSPWQPLRASSFEAAMPVLANARHERFAQSLAQGKSATEAMRDAGYTDPRNSTRLTKNDEISSRVAELKGQAAANTVTTVEDIARQLDEDRAFARENGAAAAAVAATLGKAKVLGLVVDKAENVNYNVDVTDEPASEEDWAAEHKPN
jgi:phage terminase small subunit